jgi:catechol 2,3-dioxygenase-like lactoylglutathione lyase family enzyme
MDPIRYTGINHLALATRDMDQTIRFWRDLLGMRLVIGMGRPGYRHYFFEVSPHDMVAFFEWQHVEPVAEKDHGVPVNGPLAFDHVAFSVEHGEALWTLKARLEAAGFWVSEVIDHGFIHSIYTFDPNRIAIEFSAPVAGVDLRRSPRVIDPHPSAITREGSEPQASQWPEPQRPIPPEERQVFPGEGLQLLAGQGPHPQAR